jgi:hypothetical protein
MSELESRALLRFADRLILPGGSDEDAADHETCFGRNAFPHSGVFLGEQAQVGGGDAGALGDRYRRLGFTPDPLKEEPDHLSTQLRALGWLVGAEADAQGDGEDAQVQRMRGLQREFLDGHVLRWLPVWAGTARRVGGDAPAALASAVERRVIGVRQALGGDVEAWQLPPAALDLDDTSTGLREITGWLCTPSRCGLLVTGEDVARLGRGLGVPRGFGDRRLLLGNLLRGAGQFGQTEALVEGLRQLVDCARDALDEGPAAEFSGPWVERLAETSALLARVGEAVAAPLAH